MPRLYLNLLLARRGLFFRARNTFGIQLPQHEAQDFLRNRRAPHRRERLPVQRRRPMLSERGEVWRCAISLVRRQMIHGKDRVPGGDHAVALDLRENRRGSD